MGLKPSKSHLAPPKLTIGQGEPLVCIAPPLAPPPASPPAPHHSAVEIVDADEEPRASVVTKSSDITGPIAPPAPHCAVEIVNADEEPHPEAQPEAKPEAYPPVFSDSSSAGSTSPRPRQADSSKSALPRPHELSAVKVRPTARVRTCQQNWQMMIRKELGGGLGLDLAWERMDKRVYEGGVRRRRLAQGRPMDGDPGQVVWSHVEALNYHASGW